MSCNLSHVASEPFVPCPSIWDLSHEPVLLFETTERAARVPRVRARTRGTRVEALESILQQSFLQKGGLLEVGGGDRTRVAL